MSVQRQFQTSVCQMKTKYSLASSVRARFWWTGARPMSSRISVDHIRLKRAYEPPASDDGIRILIDRLWPRGVKKSDAAIDEWMKEIAPSTKLRKWFSHDPERWQEFRRRYQTEIRHHPDEFNRLRTLAQRGRITLVFSAHDEAHNDAVVLKDLLLERT
jgi:uncharacterized protein YeaO (DUF488 family)